MKWRVSFVLCLNVLALQAQRMDTISLSKDKIVYILFDSDVTLAETGTKDYAVIFKDNMAFVKAVRETPVNTTLMVRTKTDIQVWIIRYSTNPDRVLIDTRNDDRKVSESIVPDSKSNALTEQRRPNDKSESKPNITQKATRPLDIPTPGIIEARIKAGNRDCDIYDPALLKKVWKMITQPADFFDIGEKENGIYFVLQNIYVDKQYIYLKMSMYNTSSISFDIDFMSFERIQSSGLRKREIRNTNMISLAHRESVVSVLPNTEEPFVYILPLVAPNDKDKVHVKVNEMGGARSFEFDIPVKEIVNAKSI